MPKLVGAFYVERVEPPDGACGVLRGDPQAFLMRLQFHKNVVNAALPDRFRPATVQALFVEHRRGAPGVAQRVHQVEDGRHLAE